LTGASFSDVRSGLSPLKLDTSATAATGGNRVNGVTLAKSDSKEIVFINRYDGVLNPGDTYTFTGDAFSGTNAEFTVSIRWIESN
jgi:hypothetical protein